MTETDYRKLIKDATHIGTFSHEDPEWHELRNGKIGGSMVGTIAGLNKWESAVTAFYKFTKQIDDTVEDSPAMEWGRRLEDPIILKFQDEHPELTVFTDVGTWINKARDYQLANPDGLILRNGELGVLEIKTAAYKDDWFDESGEMRIPLYYQTQVQWYLSTLGLKFAHVAVLFSGREYMEFELQADKFQQGIDIELVEKFLEACATKTQPAWDGSNSTYETIRRVHPQIDDTQAELGQLGLDYLEADKALKTASEAVTSLKSQVLAEMNRAKVGTIDGTPRFWRRSRAGGLPFLVAK
jgi:putative phage-type endonuclease